MRPCTTLASIEGAPESRTNWMARLYSGASPSGPCSQKPENGSPSQIERRNESLRCLMASGYCPAFRARSPSSHRIRVWHIRSATTLPASAYEQSSRRSIVPTAALFFSTHSAQLSDSACPALVYLPYDPLRKSSTSRMLRCSISSQWLNERLRMLSGMPHVDLIELPMQCRPKKHWSG
eukprot:scaffold356_cov69-Phaeocystis_antarctica.AAC.7